MYGLKPWELQRLTAKQLAYYLHHLPHVRGHSNYSVAMLMAELSNAFTPRYVGPDPDSESSSAKPARPVDPWRPNEFLPPDSADPFEVVLVPYPVEVSAVLLEHQGDLPSWCSGLIDWNRVVLTRG